MKHSKRSKASPAGPAKTKKRYNAERILAVRVEQGRKEYQIKWVGFEDPKDITWEPTATLVEGGGIHWWLYDYDRAQTAEKELAFERKRNNELTAALRLNRGGKRKGDTDSDPTSSTAGNTDDKVAVGVKKVKADKVKDNANGSDGKTGGKLEGQQKEVQVLLPIKQEIVENPPPEQPVSDPAGGVLCQEVESLKLLLKEKDEKIATLEGATSLWETDKKTLENKLFMQAATLDKNYLTIKKSSSAQSKYDTLKDKYKGLNGTLLDLQTKFSDLELKFSDLELKNIGYKQQITKMTGSSAESVRNVSELLQNKDQLARKNMSLCTQNDVLSLQAKNLDREKQLMEEELTKKSEEVRKAHLRHDDLIQRHSEKNARIEQLQKNVLQLEEAQSVKDSRIKKLEQDQLRRIIKHFGEAATIQGLREQRDKLKKICLEMLESHKGLLQDKGQGEGGSIAHDDTKCPWKAELQDWEIKYSRVKCELDELINIRLRLEDQLRVMNEKIGAEGGGAVA